MEMTKSFNIKEMAYDVNKHHLSFHIDIGEGLVTISESVGIYTKEQILDALSSFIDKEIERR